MIGVGVVIPCLSTNLERAEKLKDKLKEYHPDIEVLIAADEIVDELDFGEKGFTINVNYGIKTLMQAHSGLEYFWILNDDAYPSKEYLLHCLEAFDKDESIGIVSSTIVDSKDRNMVIWGGSLQCYPNGLHKGGFLNQKNTDIHKESYQKWITFVSVVLRKKWLTQIGLLDETMRFVFSDSDWCYRLRAAGGKCLYYPGALTAHDTGIATGGPEKERSSQLIKEFLRDRIAFEDKWLSHKLFENLDREAL